ncbi:MAG: ParA family protein [Chlamydiota bacterium]|nr:ParA family protein [Chlamydiota bacterium]
MVTLAVSSFKGGTAKTSLSLNIGAALATFHNQRVLLVDFDAQANLTAGMGMDPDHHDSLASVLQGEKSIKEVILPTHVKQLDIIPADTWLERVELGGSLAGDRYSHEKLKKVLSPLSYDIILIDTPPSLCWLTESSLIAADWAMVCATPEFYSIKGLQRLSYFMDYIRERHPFENLGVAISFWNARGKHNSQFLEAIEEAFPGSLLQTKIRRDIAVSESALQGTPTFMLRPKSRAASDFLAITKEITKKIIPHGELLASSH